MTCEDLRLPWCLILKTIFCQKEKFSWCSAVNQLASVQEVLFSVSSTWHWKDWLPFASRKCSFRFVRITVAQLLSFSTYFRTDSCRALWSSYHYCNSLLMTQQNFILSSVSSRNQPLNFLLSCFCIMWAKTPKFVFLAILSEIWCSFLFSSGSLVRFGFG